MDSAYLIGIRYDTLYSGDKGVKCALFSSWTSYQSDLKMHKSNNSIIFASSGKKNHISHIPFLILKYQISREAGSLCKMKLTKQISPLTFI